MKILSVGDVCGIAGMTYFINNIAEIKKQYSIDLCIVNGENSDKSGIGLSKQSAAGLLKYGADVITAGNHSFRREGEDFYSEHENIIHPANFPETPISNGMYIATLCEKPVAVINLIGVTYMEPVENPFFCIDRYLKILNRQNIKHIIIDFHAEATAEKRSLAYYLDGKISAIYGTHTHTQTSDEQVLPNGTGYITDIGMTGVYHSVLGIKKERAIEKHRLHRNAAFEPATGPCSLNAAVFTIDDQTALCKEVQRVLILELL